MLHSKILSRGLLATAGVATLLTAGGIGGAAIYNSEEHKLIADRGASLVDPGSAMLPSPTRFHVYTSAEAGANYRYAKNLAVGITSNDPSQYSEDTKKVQDNSYWDGDGYAQRVGNLDIHIPGASELAMRTLLVTAWLGSDAAFTFGELVALYGDYRRTVHCAVGRCYLTNSDAPQYRFQIGDRDPQTIYFEYGDDCFGLSCGWRPDPVPTRSYLRAIGSGLWPPYGTLGNTISNTAWEEEELDAGWWGDEMLRLANVNDWHFSSAAIAWYVGMHRLALLSVEAARTDPVYWNKALHYEASALHSLTDLFAFGHVVTNRDRTSYGIMYDEGLLTDQSYRWMENVLVMGGGSRNPSRLDGKLSLTTTLPPISDLPTSRNDFMASYRGTWALRAKTEHDYHSQFNNSGALVMNLKRQEFYIYGDARLRNTSATAQDVIAETVRASVQSLFDAYASGESIGTIGAFGSSYFDALLNVPIFVKTHPEGLFDGQWTRFAAHVDRVTNAGLVPADAPSCEMTYIDGDVALPSPRSAPCTEPVPPTQEMIVEELLRHNGALPRADRVSLDDEGNSNGGYDVGDFLAWVRTSGASPSSIRGAPPVGRRGGSP